MFKIFSQIFLSSCVFFGTTFSALASEKVTTQIKIFKIENQQETLLLAPRIIAQVNEQGAFQIEGEDLPAISIKVLVQKNPDNLYKLLSQFSIANQDGTLEIDSLDPLKTNATILLNTSQGRFKMSLVSQSDNHD